MIPYENLCRALDIYNRKLRGEDVPEEAYPEQIVDDDFDIVESADAQDVDLQMEDRYGEGVPQADFGGYEQVPQQQPGAHPDDQDPNRQQ